MKIEITRYSEHAQHWTAAMNFEIQVTYVVRPNMVTKGMLGSWRNVEKEGKTNRGKQLPHIMVNWLAAGVGK